MCLVSNILWVYDNAQMHNKYEGRLWYHKALLKAEQIAAIAGTTVDVAVAVIAVLSPRNRWERNIQDAITVAGAHRAGGPYNIKAGTFNSNVEKAFQILKTGDLARLSGDKVTAFMDNILNTVSERVTVDVWAVRVADLAPRDVVAKFDYALYEQAYQKATDYINSKPGSAGLMLPKHVQAITWLEMRGRVARKIPTNQLVLF